MRSGRYSIRELLSDGDIGALCIPEIQRDYVWPEDKVVPFVQDVISSALRPQDKMFVDGVPDKHKTAYCEFLRSVVDRHNIGFVYAYYDPQVPERYFLIDGQQRLTTIYLLLAVLAAKNKDLRAAFESRYFQRTFAAQDDKDWRSYALKVDYRVREVSHVFLQHYIYELISRGWETGETTFQVDWWQSRFADDVTIASVRRNVNLIARILDEQLNRADHGRDLDRQACEKLFSYIEDSVEVWYFDTSLSTQGEELYIYMNSRGEQLSYNENCRVACMKTWDGDKRKLGENWDSLLQNFYWKRRANGIDSADPGLDLFLHAVEMIFWSLKKEEKNITVKELYRKWEDFLKNGIPIKIESNRELTEAYFQYQQSVEFLYRCNEFREMSGWSDTFERLQQGLPAEKFPTQIEILPILICLELFKGREDDNVSPVSSSKVKVAFLFFGNLLRQVEIRKNPSHYVDQCLTLAEACRLNDFDIVKLNECTNSLLDNSDEKWKLKLLAKRRERGMTEAQELELVELWEKYAGNSDLEDLFDGNLYLLFAVSFSKKADDANDAVLASASECSHDVLKACLDANFNRVLQCFVGNAAESSPIPQTVRGLLQHGNYSVWQDGAWYQWRLGLKSDSWRSEWHGIIYKSEDRSCPSANPYVVAYLKTQLVDDKVVRRELPSEFRVLQLADSMMPSGNGVFEWLWKNPWVEGRFRADGADSNGWKIVFKGKVPLIQLLSKGYADRVDKYERIAVGNNEPKRCEVFLMIKNEKLVYRLKCDGVDKELECVEDLDNAISGVQ